MASEGVLLGMGNPLLDISATVKPELLTKYNLKANDAILYEKEDLFEELLKDYKVEYIAGGATQNSVRVAQWILKGKNQAAYFGCVGNDTSSKILEACADEAGVLVRYQTHAEHPTGRCAVLITGQDRSLVTKLDAANHYTEEHLNDPENWKLVENAKVFYSAGFFLTVSPGSMLKVAKHANATGKTYCMNLSAPFLCEFFKAPMLEVMEFADIVFGNEDEAETFGKANGLEGKSRTEIAQHISNLPYPNKQKKRVVVITQGSDPVIVVDDTGAVTEHPVIALPKEKIVDTNGAGDAFVGGFLAQYVLGKDMATCVRCGIWAATEIIQRSGCTFPPEMTFA